MRMEKAITKKIKNNGIPEGWGLKELGSLGRVVTGKTPPTEDLNSFGKDGYPFITPRDMHGQKYIRTAERYLTEKGKDVVRNCLLPANSVCVSCIGSDMGKVVMTDRPSITNQQLNSLICQHADPHFVYYGIVNISKRLRDAAFHSTAVPILNKSDFSRFEIFVPQEDIEQHAIAKILSDLDAKIELNHQMNKTLESIAQAIFKQWFVDFVENGLPSGWELGNLGDIAESKKQAIQPNAIKSSMSYIGLEHLPRKSIALSDWEEAIDLGSNKFRFSRGDILFGKLRPYFHKVGVAPTNGVCSTDILVVVPRKPEWFGLVLGHVSSDSFVNYTTNTSTGTRMPRTSWQDMALYEIALPPETTAAKFTAQVNPLIERMIFNIHESRILTNIRDSLLPRLMSGKIRTI